VLDLFVDRGQLLHGRRVGQPGERVDETTECVEVTLIHPERFSREFKRAQHRYNPDAQLPEITLHALRHGWATVALEAGVPMKVVQDRLNHATERITAEIYTHVRAPMQFRRRQARCGVALASRSSTASELALEFGMSPQVL